MSIKRILGVFFRYFYTVLKGPHHLSDLFYWPFVDILLWGLTSVWIQRQSAEQDLPLILMTGLIFWQIAWRGSIDISVNLLQEFWHRNLVNLFSTPLRISEWAAGVILLSIAKLGVTIAFGGVVVYLLYALNVFTVGAAFLPFAALLILFGWSLGFISAGLIIYWGHQVEMICWMIAFLFAPFSAVFYPIDVLPAWAQTIGWCLPTTYVFEGMRILLKGGELPWSYLFMSFVLDLVFISASVAFFISMFRKSRMKGLARWE